MEFGSGVSDEVLKFDSHDRARLEGILSVCTARIEVLGMRTVASAGRRIHAVRRVTAIASAFALNRDGCGGI